MGFSTRRLRRLAGVGVTTAAVTVGVAGCDPAPPPWSSLEVVSTDASGPLPGDAIDLDLSADGDTVAFHGFVTGSHPVDYVRDLTTGTLSTPTWADSAGRPILTPSPLRLSGDGDQVATFGCPQSPFGDTCSLMTGDVAGGTMTPRKSLPFILNPHDYRVTPDLATVPWVPGNQPYSVHANTGVDQDVVLTSPGSPELGDYFRTPAVSDDGSVVSFASEGDATGQDVHLYDLEAGTLTTVTDGPGDNALVGGVTRDGLTVIVYGTLDGEPGLHAYDVASGTSELLLPELDAPIIEFGASADGQRIVFTKGYDQSSGAIWMLDRAAHSFVQLSVDGDNRPGNGPSYEPSISADGRTVSFLSQATSLSPDDTHAAASAYVLTLP